MPVDLANKPGSPVVFDSALSLGDKSALAFAFFLARLENDPKRFEQIVVFDDPLSSLDSCRRRYARIQMLPSRRRLHNLSSRPLLRTSLDD
jgi:wobble nucleotide-excising tRNase